MQKHTEWLSNRGYAQHLTVLTKIKERNIKAVLNYPKKVKKQNRPDHSGITLKEPTEENKSLERCSMREGQQKMFKLNKSTSGGLSMRAQQILWDNYHLGKRIIETPPVISKRRLDFEYRKHKRLVQCLTASSNRKTISNEYRIKKLEQYNENIGVITDDCRILNNVKKSTLLHLKITDFILNRQKSAFEDITLTLNYKSQTSRVKQQVSECISYQKLFGYDFYFNLKKKHILEHVPICIQIKNIKGLSELSIGFFTFQLDQSKMKDGESAKLFHCGKFIGEIVFNYSYGSKKQFIQLFAEDIE